MSDTFLFVRLFGAGCQAGVAKSCDSRIGICVAWTPTSRGTSIFRTYTSPVTRTSYPRLPEATNPSDPPLGGVSLIGSRALHRAAGAVDTRWLEAIITSGF